MHIIKILSCMFPLVTDENEAGNKTIDFFRPRWPRWEFIAKTARYYLNLRNGKKVTNKTENLELKTCKNWCFNEVKKNLNKSSIEMGITCSWKRYYVLVDLLKTPEIFDFFPISSAHFSFFSFVFVKSSNSTTKTPTVNNGSDWVLENVAYEWTSLVSLTCLLTTPWTEIDNNGEFLVLHRIVD